MRWLRLLLTGLQLILMPVLAASSHAAGPAPVTIPALRQWSAAGGTYRFGPSTRVVVDPAFSTQLDGDAATFAGDLSALTGRTVTVADGTAVRGDISLTLGDAGLPAEGYRMTVGSTVAIQAGTSDGAFNGTRTALQLLHQSWQIPAGTAVDWPSKPERGLMIDQGRKFFTVGWVKQHITELAYLKLNYFHFHLSDSLGFRLESSTHPEIVSADHYSKQDIADLVSLGRRYHVTIVPEIDTPGHLDAVLAAHPELRLTDRAGTASPEFIDLSNPGSYPLIKDLITEYLPLFPAPYWHIGADEYVTDYASYPQLLSYARAHYGAGATAKDTFYGYVNWADALVRAAGKTTRMWNDGIDAGDGTIAPNADILVEYWSGYGLTPTRLAEAGHAVANASWTPTYYILGGDKPDTQWMYRDWNPDVFQGANPLGDGAGNRGSLIHVWCDDPAAETEDQVAAGIMDPLRGLAQRTWGSPRPVADYADFVPLILAIGHNPEWPLAVHPGDLALHRPVTVSGAESPDFPGAAAVDGDPATRWASLHVDPGWIQIDLGISRAVDHVVLRWETAYARAYRIQLSDDAVTWRTVYSTTAGAGGTETLSGLVGSGRYIRMYGTQRATSFGYSLYAFEVYGPGPGPNRGRQSSAAGFRPELG